MYPYYRWRSGDELLLFEGRVREPKLQKLVTLHVPGRKHMDIPRFASVWKEVRKGPFVNVDQYINEASISPDGREMLFHNEPGVSVMGDLPYLQWINELGTDRYHRIDTAKKVAMWTFVWLDGKRLLAVTDEGFDVLTFAQRVKVVNHPYPDGNRKTARDLYAHGFLGNDGRLFFLSAWIHNAYEAPTTIELREIKSGDDFSLLKKHTVSVPPCNYVVGVVLSPDETTLAWNVAVGPGDEGENQVWITDLDSGHRRLLVDHIHPPRDMFYDMTWHEGVVVAWRPVSSEISYNHGGKLWVVDTKHLP